MPKIGRIVTHGVSLEKHEYDTLIFLVERGISVEVIPPSYTKGQHTADVLINGVAWEIKSPQGRSRKTLERNVRRALRQSENVIIDLRRIGLSTEECLKLLEAQYHLRRSLKRLKVVTKTGKVLDMVR